MIGPIGMKNVSFGTIDIKYTSKDFEEAKQKVEAEVELLEANTDRDKFSIGLPVPHGPVTNTDIYTYRVTVRALSFNHNCHHGKDLRDLDSPFVSSDIYCNELACQEARVDRALADEKAFLDEVGQNTEGETRRQYLENKGFEIEEDAEEWRETLQGVERDKTSLDEAVFG